MSEMLSMQYEDLTGQNLVEKGDNFVLSGLSKNVGREGPVIQEDLQLTRDHQKPCLLLILTQLIPEQEIWRSTLIRLGKY
jgi:hypothetical protein